MFKQNKNTGVSGLELEIIRSENKKAMQNPLRMIALITVVSGLFALVFEVRYFKDASIFIYAFRFFALAIAFWILILLNFEFGKKSVYLLAHTLLFSITLSFAAVIIFVPNTLVVNSQVAALTVFTAAIFFTWEIENQIIVAIYYNLIFGATLLLNRNDIHYIQNIFAAVIFIIFLSTLSISAVAIISKFRQESIIKNIRIIETQKKYRAMFENAIEAMFQASYEGDILVANTSFYRVFNFIDSKSILSLSDGSLIKSSELKRLMERIKLNGMVTNFMTRITLEYGEEKIYKINARSTTDINTNEPLIEGSIQDITKQIKIDESLRIAKEKAEASDRLKTEFLNTISHEIRTPLNAMINAGEYIKLELKDKLSDNLKSIFQMIDSSGRQIVRTIQLILNLSEIQSGLYSITNTNFDLYEKCLKPIVDELNYTLTNEKVSLILEEPLVDSQVTADEYSVNQIFRNLIENGIKFTNSGSVKISVDRDEDLKLRVTVKDTGIGIDEEYLPHMFSFFSQEYKGLSRKYNGNGIGLALVKRYCNLNGIDITVKSKKNVGTSFTAIFSRS